ncbi:MAG: hypothetical protein QHC79_17710 [Pseudosphingobacterium sp.]|uniref:hypothetical protein n=1 Tax=Olivibacter sp. 47 TaxID=3056486 RepID=UPI0025A38CC9|nr:hypothetical protein [Olivibacter sp. 47]MDM8173167.1 hypothetical protein [Olivibacter sp. 47]MDX3915385.1 hypothetical protein [Pseudosphingobacterium sp.]
MVNINDLNTDFLDFIFLSIDHGIDSIKDDDELLVPFLIISKDGDTSLKRFATDKYEDSIRVAEEQLSSLPYTPDFALIVYDGYVTIAKKKYDAILVKAYDKTEQFGYIFAQRYSIADAKLETLGNVALIEAIENSLK